MHCDFSVSAPSPIHKKIIGYHCDFSVSAPSPVLKKKKLVTIVTFQFHFLVMKFVTDLTSQSKFLLSFLSVVVVVVTVVVF